MNDESDSMHMHHCPSVRLGRIIVGLVILVGLTGCAQEGPRDLINKEKAAGHHWQECELAKQAVRSDRSLLVALGECYEQGWGALSRDEEAAISYYEQGARWGNPESVAALDRLGVAVPEADLLHEEHKHLDERRAAELKHAVLLTLVGSEESIARHPHYEPVSGALGAKTGTNIAGSPAFAAYLDERRRSGLPPACASIYINGRKADSRGECK